MCLIQTFSTHLTLYRALWYHKLSMRPSWTLCTLFIDALWLWSRWLCSQCSWCFLYGPTRLIILSHLSLSFSSFHIGHCVCGAFVLWYDANNAFIFSISLVIKKLFHAVYSSTWHLIMLRLFRKTFFLSTVVMKVHLQIHLPTCFYFILYLYISTVKYKDIKCFGHLCTADNIICRCDWTMFCD